MAAEALVELVEHPLLYADGVSRTAYYDTIGDIGLTLAGAVSLAAALALPAGFPQRDLVIFLPDLEDQRLKI